MPRSSRRPLAVFVTLASGAVLGTVACGGNPPPPAHSDVAPPVVAAPPAPPPAPVATVDGSPASDDEDPDESDAPIALVPEITRPWDKASFPAKSGDEEKCWRSVPITGHAQADFDALIASCGTPMGLMEYAKPAHGHLHSAKDKRDTFSVKLSKGLCYRYFAVGDSGIKDIDILVEKKGNVLVGDDKQTGPVAIIDAGKTWCMSEDAEYFFNVEVDGEGRGKYVFGVWARPK
jgi:hypothetical protein